MSNIAILINISSQADGNPIGFNLLDDGVIFHADYTHDDLIIGYSALMDLADAIKLKIDSLNN